MAKLKRYLVFSSSTYYPSGGWHDFVDSFDDKEEALKKADEGSDNREVVDIETGEEIYEWPEKRK